MNKLYQKGREREYKVMELLRKEGYRVSRSAGSHGAADVIAAKDGHVLLVQVKSGRARMKKEELEELILWGRSFNGDAEVWHFKGRGVLEKRTVHRARKVGPPH
ncbi:MAG: group I intron-associated PD-(D/E)XK endonuclease [Thaumarchaeota archaeon]|nr:group I intron-associated PD-(D/E)XK endonuclease [Nitrososphaerota archaeon]